MNHNLTWQQSAWLAAAFAALAAAAWTVSAVRDGTQRSGDRARRRLLGPATFLREAALVVALYSVWQWVGSTAQRATAGAVDRGEAIVAFQHAAHLPDEHTVQEWILPHPLVTEAANLYYATAHFAAMIAMLIWLFACHRKCYGAVRTVVAVSTAACFALSLLSVAPPRLLPDAGFVDTARAYGQSVYSATSVFGPNELAAMPSVHVAWAFLVGCVVWRLAGRGWAWLGPLHVVLTVVVVVATANHYWLDGVVAVAIVILSAVLTRGAYAAAARVRRRVGARAGLSRTYRIRFPRRLPPSRRCARRPGSIGGTVPRGDPPASGAPTCATRTSSSGSARSTTRTPRPDPRRTRHPARSSR